MSKKSILTLIFTLILSFSLQGAVIAEKDSDNKKASTKTEKVEEKKEKDENAFPDLNTDYYLLAELDSGKVLKVKNGDKKVFPASTTKILTAIIALESCDMSEVVTATTEAISPITRQHSNMGLLVDEQLTVEQLLYGLLVHSANDAANVLGVHISGSLEEFAKLMNERAEELGAENTHFTNAHGFHDDDHYTTVNDLARITTYAMKNETFREIVATAKYTVPPTNKYRDSNTGNVRYLTNTNKMISANTGATHIYKYAIGVKTGSTDEAGNCLVAAAEKNGTRLLSIVMKCENENATDKAYSFVDSRALLEYGFKNYTYRTIGSTSDVVEASKVREAKDNVRVSLSPAEDIKVILSKDVDLNSIEVISEKKEDIVAPVKKGDVLGSVQYKLDGEVLGETDLVATNDVEQDMLLHIIYLVWGSLWIIVLVGVVILILTLYIKAVKRKRRRARRRKLRTDNSEPTMQRRRRK